MRPVQTASCNVALGAPKDWDREECCQGLPVHYDRTAGLIHSYWQPTEVDIANILAGMPIRLTTVGSQHPAVSLTVTDN